MSSPGAKRQEEEPSRPRDHAGGWSLGRDLTSIGASDRARAAGARASVPMRCLRPVRLIERLHHPGDMLDDRVDDLAEHR